MGQGSSSLPSDSCLNCPHRKHSSWRALDDAAMAEVDRARRVRHLDPGQALFSQGDESEAVCCIRSGVVGERKLDSEGNAVLLALRYPGDLVGYRPAVAGTEHRTSAEAATESTVCVIDAGTVTETMDEHPELTRELLLRSSAEADRAQESLFRMATLSNRDRLIQVLLELMRRHAKGPANGPQKLELPVSRRDLASMVGVRHETLSRILGRLEQEGLARFSGRHVTIPDVRALEAAARQAELD